MSFVEDRLAEVLREVIPMLRTLKEVVDTLEIPDDLKYRLQDHEDRLNKVIIDGKPHTWGM